MSKKLTLVIIFCLFMFAGKAFAQGNQKIVIKFSSIYSNLDKDCKTIKGGAGTDDASLCKGVEGYRINVSAAAAVVFISAQTPDKKDSIPLATQDLGFDQKKSTIEWRMADGKPFAVIMRVAKYGATDDKNPYIGKKIGEELIVKGLKGYETIDFKVDAETPDANTKARGLADSAYLNKIKKTITIVL